jgi:CBS domain-containing protein
MEANTSLRSDGEPRMKIREIMRAPRAILSPETHVTQALARLRECGVPSLPVASRNGNLLGLVLLADLSQVLAETAETGAETVRQHLSSHLVTATPEMEVSRLAEMMRYKGMENIMVTEGWTLVGALSLEEVSRAA